MSIENVTIRQLQDSIEAHRRLLAESNKKADEAQRQLIRIGLDFCGEQFDQIQKNGLILETASPETLGSLISNSLKVILAGIDHQSLKWPERLEEMSRKVALLQSQVDVETRRAIQAEERSLQLERQANSLDQSLLQERRKARDLPVDGPIQNYHGLPQWFELWSKRKAFDRDKQVILLLGDTGYSRLTEIQQALVQRFSLSERAAYRGVGACEQEGLIERRAGVSIHGRPTDLIFLTEKGKWTYAHIQNKVPRPAEYEALIKAHKSDRHTALILKTADLFTALGFAVERSPVQIMLGDNRYYLPDLVVRKDSEMFYMEVETGERADRSSLIRKWENAFLAGAGRMCVAAPRPGVMNTVQSMILNWATENDKKPNLYLTHLEALKKCSPGDSPWVRIR